MAEPLPVPPLAGLPLGSLVLVGHFVGVALTAVEFVECPGPILQPQLHSFELDLFVLGPHQLVQMELGLVGRVLELPQAGGPVQDVPVGLVLARPLLAGSGLAVDLLGDVIPGAADGTEFSGEGEEGIELAAHG
jgi:hypothetical protein